MANGVSIEFIKDPYIKMHIGANVFHYGQSCFEGLKAYKGANNKVHLFRPYENAKRLQRSAQRICMEAPSQELFLEACQIAIQGNQEFIPPYGTGASLYIRPVLIGTQEMIGIASSNTYTFIVMVTPVGAYYPNGFSPVQAIIFDHIDRCAPNGTGMAKVAGNYAAGLLAQKNAKEQGFSIVLYTDSQEHQYIDEFGTSNFIGISNNEYITPKSNSILPSITNSSLQIIAQQMGLTVTHRPIAVSELSQFQEVGACGTAAIITPIQEIHHKEQIWSYSKHSKLQELYQHIQHIQYAEIEDQNDWLFPISI